MVSKHQQQQLGASKQWNLQGLCRCHLGSTRCSRHCCCPQSVRWLRITHTRSGSNSSTNLAEGSSAALCGCTRKGQDGTCRLSRHWQQPNTPGSLEAPCSWEHHAELSQLGHCVCRESGVTLQSTATSESIVITRLLPWLPATPLQRQGRAGQGRAGRGRAGLPRAGWGGAEQQH